MSARPIVLKIFATVVLLTVSGLHQVQAHFFIRRSVERNHNS